MQKWFEKKFVNYVGKLEEIRPIRVMGIGENRASIDRFKKSPSRGQR
jgi:hypothetical protein